MNLVKLCMEAAGARSGIQLGGQKKGRDAWQLAAMNSRGEAGGCCVLTVSMFSVRMSSDRFSQSPIDSVTSVSLFWSTLRMESCFS